MNDTLKPKNIKDYKFNQNKKNKVFYGLPSEIIFCKKCTYSNQKPISEKEFEHKEKTKKQF